MSEEPGKPGNLNDKDGGQACKVGEPEAEVINKTSMKSNIVLLGIDVGSKELVTARRGPEGRPLMRSFTNAPEGHRQFLAYARSCVAAGGIVRVALEATGAYSLEISLLLSRSAGFEVMVSNPKTIKNFLRARGVRGKTDRIDAVGILSFLETFEFRKWQTPAEKVIALQGIGRRIYQLNAEKNREENRLDAVTLQGKAGKLVAADLKKSITQIERRILALEQAGIALINEDPKLQRALDLLTSVKGIAKRSAIRLLGELLVLPPDMKAPQWVAQAGLDPRVRQSGTSLDGHRYISKAGNRYIRAALFMPAMVAIQKEPVVKAHYTNMVQNRGKEKMIAIIAVMRKLLLSIYGMLKNDAPFDPSKFSSFNNPIKENIPNLA